jgi:hypothetical protein
VLFLVGHAILIVPIWKPEALYGGLYGLVGGGFLGLVYRDVRADIIFTGVVRGAVFGFIVGLMVLPFLAVQTLSGGNLLSAGFPAFVAVFAAVGTIGFTSAILVFSGETEIVTPALLRNAFIFGLAGLFVSLFATGVATDRAAVGERALGLSIALSLIFMICGLALELLLERSEGRALTAAKGG